MDKRLLSHDPLTGLSEYHSYDPDTDTTIIQTVGDCLPYLEANKERANSDEFSREGIKREFWLYASIPPALQVKFLIEDGIDVYNRQHSDRLFRKLNDPDYRYLKCTTKNHTVK